MIPLNKLKSKLIKYNKAYRDGNPLVSDREYDNLLKLYREYVSEEEYYTFIKTLHEDPGKFNHSFIIGSVDRLLKEDFDKWLMKYSIENIIAVDKLDGNSIVLYYDNNGILSNVVTRGDGYNGVEVFNIDKSINKNKFFPNAVVRGEIIIHNKDFLEMKKRFEEYSEAKNPRNLVSGIVKREEIKPEILPYLKFYAFEILNSDLSYYEQLDVLKNQGFLVPYYTIYNVKEQSELFECIEDLLIKRKDESLYDMDGIVITSSDYVVEDKYIPNLRRAIKIDCEEKIAKLKDIEWNTSKEGKIIPTGILEPVELNGTTVSRCTLYNASFIIKNNIYKGVNIKIIKSGEIIPKAIDVFSEKEDYDLIEECPSCNNKLKFDETKVNLICDNPDCSVKNIKKVVKLLKNFKIKGFSERMLIKLGVSDLYSLIDYKVEDSKYKKQKELYNNIKNIILKADKKTLLRNYPFNSIGKKIIDIFIDYYGIDNIFEKAFNKDGYPNGIEDITFNKFVTQLDDFFNFYVYVINHPEYKCVIEEVKKEEIKNNSNITDKSFCFTGTLTYPRNFYETKVKENGGVIKNVSKNLDYLVVGEKAGSKLKKAKSLNIKILNEEEFLSFLE